MHWACVEEILGGCFCRKGLLHDPSTETPKFQVVHAVFLPDPGNDLVEASACINNNERFSEVVSINTFADSRPAKADNSFVMQSDRPRPSTRRTTGSNSGAGAGI